MPVRTQQAGYPFGCGSSGGTSRCLWDDVLGVAGLVDAVTFLGEVVAPVSSKSPLLAMARSLRMASAPGSPHRAPVRSILSFTRCRQAPSITPVAIGQPLASAVG